MLNSEIKRQLIDTTFLVRLNTGELMTSVVISRAHETLSLFFPCIFDEATLEMQDFCPYAVNRRIEMSSHAIQFIKSPNDQLLDAYFMHVISNHASDFIDFIQYMDSLLEQTGESISVSASEPVAKDRVLH